MISSKIGSAPSPCFPRVYIRATLHHIRRVTHSSKANRRPLLLLACAVAGVRSPANNGKYTFRSRRADAIRGSLDQLHRSHATCPITDLLSSFGTEVGIGDSSPLWSSSSVVRALLLDTQRPAPLMTSSAYEMLLTPA